MTVDVFNATGAFQWVPNIIKTSESLKVSNFFFFSICYPLLKLITIHKSTFRQQINLELRSCRVTGCGRSRYENNDKFQRVFFLDNGSMSATFFLIINGPKYVEFSGSIVCICLTSPKRPFTFFFKWAKEGEGGGVGSQISPP